MVGNHPNLHVHRTRRIGLHVHTEKMLGHHVYHNERLLGLAYNEGVLGGSNERPPGGLVALCGSAV